MEAEKTSYRPKFLDRMEGNNHIVLLYDNPKYADLIIARYLFNGLKKGESCIFFTPDNPETTERAYYYNDYQYEDKSFAIAAEVDILLVLD